MFKDKLKEGTPSSPFHSMKEKIYNKSHEFSKHQEELLSFVASIEEEYQSAKQQVENERRHNEQQRQELERFQKQLQQSQQLVEKEKELISSKLLELQQSKKNLEMADLEIKAKQERIELSLKKYHDGVKELEAKLRQKSEILLKKEAEIQQMEQQHQPQLEQERQEWYMQMAREKEAWEKQMSLQEQLMKRKYDQEMEAFKIKLEQEEINFKRKLESERKRYEQDENTLRTQFNEHAKSLEKQIEDLRAKLSLQQTESQRLELEYRLKLTKEVEGTKEQLEQEYKKRIEQEEANLRKKFNVDKEQLTQQFHAKQVSLAKKEVELDRKSMELDKRKWDLDVKEAQVHKTIEGLKLREQEFYQIEKEFDQLRKATNNYVIMNQPNTPTNGHNLSANHSHPYANTSNGNSSYTMRNTPTGNIPNGTVPASVVSPGNGPIFTSKNRSAPAAFNVFPTTQTQPPPSNTSRATLVNSNSFSNVSSSSSSSSFTSTQRRSSSSNQPSLSNIHSVQNTSNSGSNNMLPNNANNIPSNNFVDVNRRKPSPTNTIMDTAKANGTNFPNLEADLDLDVSLSLATEIQQDSERIFQKLKQSEDEIRRLSKPSLVSANSVNGTGTSSSATNSFATNPTELPNSANGTSNTIASTKPDLTDPKFVKLLSRPVPANAPGLTSTAPATVTASSQPSTAPPSPQKPSVPPLSRPILEDKLQTQQTDKESPKADSESYWEFQQFRRSIQKDLSKDTRIPTAPSSIVAPKSSDVPTNFPVTQPANGHNISLSDALGFDSTDEPEFMKRPFNVAAVTTPAANGNHPRGVSTNLKQAPDSHKVFLTPIANSGPSGNIPNGQVKHFDLDHDKNNFADIEASENWIDAPFDETDFVDLEKKMEQLQKDVDIEHQQMLDQENFQDVYPVDQVDFTPSVTPGVFPANGFSNPKPANFPIKVLNYTPVQNQRPNPVSNGYSRPFQDSSSSSSSKSKNELERKRQELLNEVEQITQKMNLSPLDSMQFKILQRDLESAQTALHRVCEMLTHSIK